MRYLSVCSGIEAATVAWHPLGWTPAAFSEVDKFPCAVLAHHYPDVPNWGDMTKFQEWPDADVDVLVGGTPCQSFSVAGLRKGLADPRGNLALTYLAILDRYRPRWCCWENVPGVLSADGGRAMGAFLGGLGELGYGFAYRVLDAQYFGLAQRRKRVFVVGHFGDWRRAAAVLFERDSLQGNPAPSREAWEGATVGTLKGTTGGVDCDHGSAGHVIPMIAKPLGGGPSADKGRGSDLDNTTYIAFDTTQVTSAANYSSPKPGEPCHPLAAGAHPSAVAFESRYARNGRGAPSEVVPPLKAQSGQSGKGDAAPLVCAFAQNTRDELREMPYVGALASQPGMKQTSYVRQEMQVRRLTPTECARLQGFPDDYLDIAYRGRPAADGPKYGALGNSFAVPVMAWIGSRIALVDALKLEKEGAA